MDAADRRGLCEREAPRGGVSCEPPRKPADEEAARDLQRDPHHGSPQETCISEARSESADDRAARRRIEREVTDEEDPDRTRRKERERREVGENAVNEAEQKPEEPGAERESQEEPAPRSGARRDGEPRHGSEPREGHEGDAGIGERQRQTAAERQKQRSDPGE